MGEVRDVGFSYDPTTGDISTPARLAIYPSLFHAKGADTVLRRAAADLDDTARSAKQLMNGTATQNCLTNTVEEITEAARAVRSLADYLDRHPEALVRGRQEDTQ